MKYCLLLFVVLCSFSAFGQTDTTKPPVYGWTHGMVAGLTVSQIAFTDWSAGGDNALSWAISGDGKSVSDEPLTNWTNTYKLAFGQARISGGGLRKTDDKIDIQSVLTYKVSLHINPYAAVTFLTQFAPGYKYDTPVAGHDLKVSDIFDPAYLTESVGAGWQPAKEVKTRLGFALRETFSKHYGYANDADGTPHASKVEGGLESVTDIDLKVAENILFTAQLGLFAPFKTIDRVDIRSDNKLTLTVNKYINAIFSLNLLNVSPYPKTQVKEVIALGFTYNVF